MNHYKTLIATSLIAHVHASLCFTGEFAHPTYQAQTAKQKLTQLWSRLLQNPAFYPPFWLGHETLFTRDMNLTFDSTTGDELPYNRIKVNHKQGVVGLIEWEDFGGHNYTGLYEGNSNGLVRLSEANFLLPEADGLTPSAAFKIFRDGIQSVNHVANTSWGPSSSYDFMARDF